MIWDSFKAPPVGVLFVIIGIQEIDYQPKEKNKSTEEE